MSDDAVAVDDLVNFDDWVGCHVLIRTIGEIIVGRLVKVTPSEIVMDRASWLAEMGRVEATFREGLQRPAGPQNDAECDWECIATGVIRQGRGVISYWTLFPHPLPLPGGAGFVNPPQRQETLMERYRYAAERDIRP